MRQIKFRGKRKDTGEWVYGDLVHTIKDILILPIDEGWNQYSVNSKTIGQFTGLCDKNGKEIYEGDILSANGRIVGWVKGEVRGYCYDVVYVNHPTEEKRWSLYSTVMYDYKGKIEITGNRFDNPELISDKR